MTLPNLKKPSITKRSGVALLTGLMAIMLVNNWFHPQLPVSISPADDKAWLVWLATGIIFSQVAVVAAWITLSTDALPQKIAFFIAIALPLFLIEMMGYLFQLSTSQNVYGWQFSQVYSAQSIVLLTLLGMMLPLMVARMFLFIHQHDRENAHNGFGEVRFSKGGFSIGTLLAITALIGLTLNAIGSSELRQTSPSAEKYTWLLISWASCGVFISTTATIPIFILTLGINRQKAIVRFLGLCGVATLLTLAMYSYLANRTVGIKMGPQFGTNPIDCVATVAGFMSSMICFTVGINLLGFRIGFAKKTS